MMPIQAMRLRANAAAFAFVGALARRITTVDTTINNLAHWNDELYDIGAWHDNSAGSDLNTKFIAPSAGMLVRVMTSYRSPFVPEILQLKNGAVFRGRAGFTLGTAGNYASAGSAIVSATTSDYFQSTSGSDITNDVRSWSSIESMDPALQQYCLAYRSATQALTANVAFAITFDTEAADTAAFHDTGSNTDRFVAPAAGAYRFSANAECSSANRKFTLATLKNGAFSAGMARNSQTRNSIVFLNVFSGWVQLSGGDYLSAEALSSLNATLSNSEAVWGMIEKMPAGHDYCQVASGTTQSFTAATEAAVLFDTDTYDAAGAHDTSSNTSRITPPSWATKAKCSFYVAPPNITGLQTARVARDGGTDAEGLPWQETNNASGVDHLAAVGAWVDIPVPGTTYYELYLTLAVTSTLTGSDGVWFQVEWR